jgi:hypothetical protein
MRSRCCSGRVRSRGRTGRWRAWANGAVARVVLMAGDPGVAIVALARELRIDLLVIGARSVRLSAVVAAPTRYRLQRDAPVPVLAVRLEASFAGDLPGGLPARVGGVG